MKLILTACLAALLSGGPQGREALKQALKDDVGAGWIYDDLAAGFAQAKKSNKPMLVVFR